MKRSPLRRVSNKKQKEDRIYYKLRAQFLKDHPFCQYWIMQNLIGISTNTEACTLEDAEVFLKVTPSFCPKSTQIHHKKGRGKYYLDVSTWMAVSDAGQTSIHANPKDSYAKGYLIPRNDSFVAHE